MKNFLLDSLGLACLVAGLYFLIWILYGLGVVQ